jgi:beta-glucanase (GH16 family)
MSELTLRYWYTKDGAQSQVYSCDYTPRGCETLTARFVPISPAASGADNYLEIGFNSAAGTLAPGQSFGAIQSHFAKSDYGDLDQTNDYSYDPTRTALADWDHITLYRNGSPVWGIDPMGTGPGLDTTPPSAPTDLASPSQSSSSISLTWAPPFDAIGVLRYDVYSGTTLLGSSASAAYSATGLAPSTTYSFTVKAWDPAGNVSPASGPFTATTLPAATDAQVRPWSGLGRGKGGGDGTRRKAMKKPVVSLLAAASFLVACRGSPASSTSARTAPPGPGWQITMQDEFESGQLDTSKWETFPPWQERIPSINDELQRYVSNAFGFEDGILRIVGDQGSITQTVGGTEYTWNYTSGFLRSKLAQQYGYFEWRMKIPPGQGLWPAIWLLKEADDTGWHEIDVMEATGAEPTRVYMTLHYGPLDALQHDLSNFAAPGFDLSTDFHVFGLEWNPDSIVWTIDGVEVKRHTGDGVQNVPLRIQMNLAIGGGLVGPPDSDTHFPAAFEIDYVRVYSRVESAGFSLNVSKSGSGSGTVSSSPAGIDCGSTCGARIASGTNVTLTATPAPGSTFAGWGGACSGTAPCTVAMSADYGVTAVFESGGGETSYTLNVSKSGTGSGTVISSPAGVDCGSTCSATFPTGTNVTLTATPAAGSTFAGWGGACGGMQTCAGSMDADFGVTATFDTDGGSVGALSTSSDGRGAGARADR